MTSISTETFPGSSMLLMPTRLSRGLVGLTNLVKKRVFQTEALPTPASP